MGRSGGTSACGPHASMSIMCFKELSNRYQMNQYDLIQLIDRFIALIRFLFP